MPLSLLSPEQIPPHIRQDHSQGACVVEDLVAPPGVEEVGDDAEAPLEEGLAARAGRGDVPKARFQEFVRFLIHGELERNARSEQAAGEPCHRLRKAQHAELVGIAPEALPVQRRILADELRWLMSLAPALLGSCPIRACRPPKAAASSVSP